MENLQVLWAYNLEKSHKSYQLGMRSWMRVLWMVKEAFRMINKCCERCGGSYEYIITPCMSKLCKICTDYLLGERKKVEPIIKIKRKQN